MIRYIVALAMVLSTCHSYSQSLSELQTFRGSDTPNGSGNTDNFGREVAISGSTAIISAPNHNGNRGAVYVFELNGSNQWVQSAKLTASDAAVGRRFGSSIAIEGDVIVAGNGSIDYPDQGAYIFEKPGLGWSNATETIKLNTTATVNSSNTSAFGFRVDINSNGSEILVGAPYEDNGTIQSGGRIYIYEKSGTSWSTVFLSAELTTTNVGSGDLIGYSATFGDNFIVTGAYTGSNAGTLHLFEKPVSGTWVNATVEDIILFGSDRSNSSSFGSDLATNGDVIVTHGATNGAISTDMNVYTFERESALWSAQSSQNEETLTNEPSYFTFPGFSSSTISFDVQSNMILIGNGISTGPTATNNAPCGSVFIRNLGSGNIAEIDGLNYAPNGLFGSAIAIEGSKVLISSPQETLGGVVRYFDLSYNESATLQLCPSGAITFGNQTITAPGTFIEMFTSTSTGLDSTVTLTVTASDLALSPSQVNNFCFGSSTGQIELTASGGILPYEYSIDGNSYSSVSTFTNLSAGNYTCYVRDANGCVFTTTVTIDEPDQLSLDTGQTNDAACNNESSGSISVSSTGGTGIVEFSVDGSNFFPSPITELAAGTYDVTARDANGCQRVIWSSVVINEPDETKSPSVVNYSTVYGTPVTGVVIQPDPTDQVATFFNITSIVEGSLYKNDGSTQINEGDFITVAEGQAGLVFIPERATIDGFSVQTAAANRSSCIGGTLVSSQIAVSKASLTATMPNQTISYGTSPDLSIDYSGFVNQEMETDLTATFNVTTQVDNFTTPGAYPITVTGTTDQNYDITFVDGSITVTNAPLTVRPLDKEITYGSSLPTLDGTLTGIVNGENITASYDTDADGSSAGTFDITASLVDPDNRLVNYSVSNTPGSLEITKASLTVTIEDTTIQYGNSLPNFVGRITGVVNQDQITLDLTTTSQGDSVGNFDITAVLVDPDSKISNYFITPDTARLTITKADLSASANPKTMVYGEPIPSLDGTLLGVVNNDDITATFNTPATSNSDAGTYVITTSIVDPKNRLSNYNATLQDDTLTILKADQTIIFDLPDTVDLADGDQLALEGEATSGLVVIYSLPAGEGSISDDTLAINSTGSFVITASQVGNNNYNAATSVTQSFVVVDSRKSDQSITFNAISEQVYGDDLTLGATASSNLAVTYTLNSGAGTITNGVLTIEGVGTYELTASQSGDDSFNPAQEVTQQFSVVKAPLSFAADDVLLTEGEAIPTLTYTVSGFRLSDDLSVVDTLPSISTLATSESLPGSYPITLTGGADNHYAISVAEGVLTIEAVLGFDDIVDVQVYPNPASHTISFDAKTLEKGTVRIVDLKGQVLIEHPYTKDGMQIDIAELAAGTYLLQYMGTEGVMTRKLLVEKQ